MRIVGGIWRGRALAAPEGRDVTRPTTDRVRESIASMLLSACGLDLEGIRVLDAFGADISDGGSCFSFTGRAVLSGGEINSMGDPLIVMAATAASCISRMPVTIRGAGVINKKYPDFFADYLALGGQVEH